MRNLCLMIAAATIATAVTKSAAFGDTIQIPVTPVSQQPRTAKNEAPDPLDEDDYIIHGLLHNADGKATDAIADFTQAVRLAPDDYFAHLCLGNAFADRDQLADAIKEMQAVVRLKPHYLGGHLRLARTLQKNKQVAESREEWKKLLDCDSPAVQKEATTALSTLNN